jgi:hypothetical protein
LPIKNLVTQDQRNSAVPDMFCAEDERLGRSVGGGLLGVGDVDADLRAVC